VDPESEFEPDSDLRAASVKALDGLLPVGEQKWRQVYDGGWKAQPLTVTLLRTEAEVVEQVEGLQLLRERLLAERAAAIEATMARTQRMTVDQYAGEECTMFHGTTTRAAQLIVRSQRFQSSVGGMLGKGVYVTTSLEKADTYRHYHPNAKALGGRKRNEPLPNGDPDIGCVLKCRARIGVCKTLAVGDPLMRRWHDAEVAEETLLRSVSARTAASTATRKFEADLELARPYAERLLAVVKRQLAPKDSVENPQLRIVYNSAYSAGCPCTPRCKKGMHSCPKANGVLEEWCVYNPDRIDRIEIIEGPGRGDGPQYWDMDADARAEVVAAAAGDGWFDAMDLADIKDVVHEWRAKVKAAAQQQLADTRAVCVEALLLNREINGVYLRVEEMHEGWVRFASAEGKHLYWCAEEWILSRSLSLTATLQSRISKLLTDCCR
jgi:hypothetical protein